MFIRPIDITEYYKSCKNSEVKFNQPNIFEKNIEYLYIQFAAMDNNQLNIDLSYILNAISLNTLCLMKDKKTLVDTKLSKVWDLFQEYVYLNCILNNKTDEKFRIRNERRFKTITNYLSEYGLPVTKETVRNQIQKRIIAVKEKSYDRKNI